MNGMRLARTIVGTLTKDRVRYPARLAADVISLIARCGILLLLYWHVFRLNGGSIHGTPYAFAAWSMFFYFAFTAFNLRYIARMMMEDVRSGTVELLFSRPISYFIYRVWWQVGSGLYSFLVISIFGSLVLAYTVGIPETMTIGVFLPSLFLVFLGSSVLTIILYGIVGMLAFWIEEINPIFWIADKAVMILGGSYLPVALFPSWMYFAARYSPFGASQFITHTPYAAWQTEWFILIGIQIGWIGLLGWILWILFERAKLKVSINGG